MRRCWAVRRGGGRRRSLGDPRQPVGRVPRTAPAPAAGTSSTAATSTSIATATRADVAGDKRFRIVDRLEPEEGAPDEGDRLCDR